MLRSEDHEFVGDLAVHADRVQRGHRRRRGHRAPLPARHRRLPPELQEGAAVPQDGRGLQPRRGPGTHRVPERIGNGNILLNNTVNYFDIIKSISISIVYFILGVIIFYSSYLGAKQRGTLINMGE